MIAIVHLGDNLEVMRGMADSSIDAICTDSPAGIAFMGRDWDHDRGGRDAWVAWLAEVLAEALRVAKPGAHALVWALPRTSGWTHRALEDAGWEVRDCITHHFGCLSDDTEILIDGGWVPYHKAKEGSLALCYNADSDSFSWQPIQETFRYAIADTVYRVQSDKTDQIVTRNHRCLVERGGRYVFQVAEEAARQRQARVPVLEDVRSLLESLPVPNQGAGNAKQNLLPNVQRQTDQSEPEGRQACADQDGDLSDVRRGIRDPSEPRKPTAEVLFVPLQRQGAGEEPRPALGQHEGAQANGPAIRPRQSRMEGRGDVLPQARELQANQVREMSAGVYGDGTQGWLCDGASPDRSDDSQSALVAFRGGASQGPRSAKQCDSESATVCQQPSTQTVRASRYTRADLVNVTPVHYEGVVWCVRVPTGAFVARRNGKAFVTGNSGFPKSLDVGKAMDKAAGAEREVVGRRTDRAATPKQDIRGGRLIGGVNGAYDGSAITAPATDLARQWDGWGTATKPSAEFWYLARKPFKGGVAGNVAAWGTGGLNIDATRVGTGEGREPYTPRLHRSSFNDDGWVGRDQSTQPAAGRWPPNTLLSHAAACRRVGVRRVKSGNPGNKTLVGDNTTPNTYGTYGKRSSAGHADPDGTEQVEAWECDESSCPVAEMDRQSGASTSRRSDTPQPIKTSKGISGGAYGNPLTLKPDGHPTTDRYVRGGFDDTGGASRFFPTFPADDPALPIDDPETTRWLYQAKAPSSERWGILTHDCETDKLLAWESQDQSHNDQTAATLPQRDISGGTLAVGSDSPTLSSGSDITGQSPTGSICTTETETRSTTTLATSNSSPRPSTSDSIQDASDETANGGSPATFVGHSNPLPNNIGTSRPKGIPSTAVVGPVTSLRSSSQGACENCGEPLRLASHPTQKSTSLMRWLVRLITPPNGTVLDCFCGSGSTGVACVLEGFNFIGIEMEPEYVEIARKRIAHATGPLFAEGGKP